MVAFRLCLLAALAATAARAQELDCAELTDLYPHSFHWNNGNTESCSASIIPDGSDPFGTCHVKDTSYGEAVAKCAVVGARLCSQAEILANVTAAAPCAGSFAGDSYCWLNEGTENVNGVPHAWVARCRHTKKHAKTLQPQGFGGTVKCCASGSPSRTSNSAAAPAHDSSNERAGRADDTSASCAAWFNVSAPSSDWSYAKVTNGGTSEHLPLYIKEKNLLICRVPKAGTLYVRGVLHAYDTDAAFRCINQSHDFRNRSLINPSPTLRHDVLEGANTTRIVFVRDPVTRTLSGWITMNGHNPSKQKFWHWLRTSFETQYTDVCDDRAIMLSKHGWLQHWTPAQFCRCGMASCGTSYRVHRIEDRAPPEVLAQYFSDAQLGLGPTNIGADGKSELRCHATGSNESDYLTPKVVRFIKRVTRKERAWFGYDKGSRWGD